MKDIIKEGNILIMKEMFEAFNYFYSGNKSVGVIATKPTRNNNVKQDLGNFFMYDCKKYGIKFINISDGIYNCEISRYHVKNDNYIVDSNMRFKYDFINERLIEVDYVYTPYSVLETKEAVKVLYK